MKIKPIYKAILLFSLIFGINTVGVVYSSNLILVVIFDVFMLFTWYSIVEMLFITKTNEYRIAKQTKLVNTLPDRTRYLIQRKEINTLTNTRMWCTINEELHLEAAEKVLWNIENGISQDPHFVIEEIKRRTY